MSEELAMSLPAAGRISTSFWLRKLHSLSGVVPVGLFLLEHFYTNSYAVYGAKAFDDAVEHLHQIPYVPLLEIFGIALPILYHAFYGIVIAALGRPNQLAFRYGRNWMYFLQRVSGAFLLLYIGLHVYNTRLMTLFQGKVVNFQYMADLFQGGGAVVIAFYVLGVLSAVFHFANGIWSFLIGWGITVSAKAQKLSAYACTAFGVALAAFGLNALMGFLGKAIVIHF